VYERLLDPRRATLVVGGDLGGVDVIALAERLFGSWAAGAEAVTPGDVTPGGVPNDAGSTAGRVIRVIHRPGSVQTEIRIGHRGLPRRIDDFHAVSVMGAILGGLFNSRLNMKLREEKGYTYGARTAFEARRGPGPFLLQASVQSDATVDAIRESLSEVSAIRGDRPVTRDELETGRAALTRGYPRNFETAEQVARAAAQMALHDLPEDYYSTFVPQVLALDEIQVTEAAARHLDPSRLLTVIVGDPERFASDLDSLALGTTLDIAAPA
jgi:zinc protease